MSSFKAILKSPKKALRNALSSGRSSTSESSTPPPLSRQAELAPNPMISQVGVFDARGATLNNVTNVGGNQTNVQNINYHGICTYAYSIVLRSVWIAYCSLASALNTLPFAKGSSWNSLSVCLPGTRVTLLEDIWTWIQSADDTKSAEIFLLSDLAGTGKSSIAHSVARRCHDNGILASSFFFDRDVAERNRPQNLFTSVARDLAPLNRGFSECINLILENDRSLAWASPSRQFEELILAPSLIHRFSRPIVIVIDALDEGYTPELLNILCDEIPKLPGSFRIFLTSRPEDHIVVALSHAAHVHQRSIDISGDANKADIGLYCRDRLRHIAFQKRMGANWPGAQLSKECQIKAEGLFIWVSAVSEYLSNPKTYDPDSKFRSLLSERNLSGLPAEQKMDKLYAEILNNSDWDDKSYVEMYHLVVGSIVALKTPLSASAIQALHREKHPALKVCEVLRPLNSLFIGSSDDKQPIRVLHLSFRDFITYRSRSSLGLERFSVDEKDYSGKLAFACLSIMNDDLCKDIPGMGYLSRDVPHQTEGIPEIADVYVSEGLWYACRFWSQHLTEVGHPMPEGFVNALRDFLSMNLIRWMEVLCSKGQFQGMADVRQWLQVSTSSLLRPSPYEQMSCDQSDNSRQ